MILDRSDFDISDANDVDAALTIRVSNVTHDQFEIAGELVTEFSLQNVVDGLVSFVHNGPEQAPSFNLTVKDDEIGASFNAPVSAMISFTNVNDAPVLGNFVD